MVCVDGFLLRIQVSEKNETGNVKTYLSGHYQAYGIKVQAACDYEYHCVYVCVAVPGGVNDITAFRKTNLHEILQKLPTGIFIAGDNAYPCSEHLLTPFSAKEKRDHKKDAYNIYLSQLCIQTEQTFGFITTKWRILRRPLQMKLINVGVVFLTITRLHNFCINEGDAVPIGDNPIFIPSDVDVANIEDN